jgi:hypothetical protein
MGRVKLTDDKLWRVDIVQLRDRYQRPETSSPERKWGISYATFIQYGLVAVLISVLIIGALSLRVH